MFQYSDSSSESELSDNVVLGLDLPVTGADGCPPNRRRARTMLDIGRSASLLHEVEDCFSESQPRLSIIPSIPSIAPRRSTPHVRLQLSIPKLPQQRILDSHGELTPLSGNSPETPASSSSTSSPIAGVVDLTKYIKTISSGAVAQGGLSDIFKGERYYHTPGGDRGDNSNGETVLVAIKVLRIMKMKDQDCVRARKRLNREVYVWHRLEHPNVVKLFGTSYHMSGRPAMIMQWYENGSAAEYLSRKAPTADRVQLVLDVSRGLSYLHTHCPPIIHGDLKGNNVLIADDGHAVLCDFGLSKVMEELGQPSGYTLSNPDMGPIRWQAPEFMEDDDAELTLSSDVWSFGCTSFELLTSRMPYAHRTKDALVIRDMQAGVKPSGHYDSLLDVFGPRTREVLEWCWTFASEERPTITEVIPHLEGICDHRS